MATKTRKKVVEQAPTKLEKEQAQIISLLEASNNSLRKAFNMLKENHEREKTA